MKKIIIVLCVLVLSACGGGGKVDNNETDTSTYPTTISTIASGTVECIRTEHPGGQQEWTDIRRSKEGTMVTHHYKYETVSCFTYK